jgi:hypothetical protein
MISGMLLVPILFLYGDAWEVATVLSDDDTAWLGWCFSGSETGFVVGM